MKIPIVYFTASGNTKYITKLVQKGLERQRLDIELVSVQEIRKRKYHINNYSIIGIASPIHDFRLARIIRLWMKNLSIETTKKKVFFIVTLGGIPGAAIPHAENIMKKKNYLSIGALEIAAPTTEPFFSQKRYPWGRWKKKILDRAFYYGLVIGRTIRTNSTDYADFRIHLPGTGFLTKLAHFEHHRWWRWPGFINYKKKSCLHYNKNSCRICEQVCPMYAINLDQKEVVDLNRCVFCATCVRYCPTHSLYISFRPHAIPPKKEIAPTLVKGYIDPNDYIPPSKLVYDRSYIANF